MFQSSYFKSRLDQVTLRGVGGGPKILENVLEWRDRDEVGKIITSPRYVIDITGTDPLPLGSWGGGSSILKN